MQQALLQVFPEFCAAITQSLVDQYVEGRETDGTCKRAAAERAAVIAWRKDAHQLPTGQEQGDRQQASPQCFAEHETIGLNVFVLTRKHPPGASETGLNLIRNQQDSMSAAYFGTAGEIAVWRNANPGFTLHRLENECRGVGRDRSLERL